MIEAIGTGGGIALTMRDPRSEQRRQRAVPRRRRAPAGVERVEIDDALAAVDLDAGLPAETMPADGPTVTAAGVARRLAGAAERAIAMQARLGSAAVRRLVGGNR